MKPYISIVTATYNSAQFLQRCIDSVANQTFRAVEHIVIDGASTDGTLEIIKSSKEKIAFWLSEPDAGIYELITLCGWDVGGDPGNRKTLYVVKSLEGFQNEAFEWGEVGKVWRVSDAP